MYWCQLMGLITKETSMYIGHQVVERDKFPEITIYNQIRDWDSYKMRLGGYSVSVKWCTYHSEKNKV